MTSTSSLVTREKTLSLIIEMTKLGMKIKALNIRYGVRYDQSISSLTTCEENSKYNHRDEEIGWRIKVVNTRHDGGDYKNGDEFVMRRN